MYLPGDGARGAVTFASRALDRRREIRATRRASIGVSARVRRSTVSRLKKGDGWAAGLLISRYVEEFSEKCTRVRCSENSSIGYGMAENYPAVRTMLADAGRLFPEERLELVQLLGIATRAEIGPEDAEPEGLPELPRAGGL